MAAGLWASAVQDGARAAAAGLLRRNATRSPSRLRDYFAATWHCTGTEVSDTFVPCVYTRVSGCYEDRSFTCHTCTDD